MEIKTLPTLTSYEPKKTPPRVGRKPGSKNKLSLLREAVLNKQEEVILTELPKIVAVVCRKAQEGDLTAAKLILERIIPVRKQSGDEANVEKKPTINIVIEGSSQTHSIKIEQPVILDSTYEELDEEE
jgi:hypothetical protein